MKLSPYLNFNGNCKEAFKFYEQLFGGKILSSMTHGGTPMESHVPKEWHDKIMHIAMAIEDQILMGSDAPPQYFAKPQGFSVSLDIKNPADAERIFNGLASNGNITMPFQQTFWAYRFGMLTDGFGIPWIVNCEKAA